MGATYDSDDIAKLVPADDPQVEDGVNRAREQLLLMHQYQCPHQIVGFFLCFINDDWMPGKQPQLMTLLAEWEKSDDSARKNQYGQIVRMLANKGATTKRLYGFTVGQLVKMTFQGKLDEALDAVRPHIRKDVPGETRNNGYKHTGEFPDLSEGGEAESDDSFDPSRF